MPKFKVHFKPFEVTAKDEAEARQLAIIKLDVYTGDCIADIFNLDTNEKLKKLKWLFILLKLVLVNVVVVICMIYVVGIVVNVDVIYIKKLKVYGITQKELLILTF